MDLAFVWLRKLDLLKFLPFFFVVLIAVIVAVQNINPSTYYSGWDNVHPELDLGLYAYRVIFGAWAEFQGLGAPAAQSYLADIPRIPILLLLKLLVPDNLNRYFYIFSMFLTGGVGMFLFLKKYWLKSSQPLRDWMAALGAVYYLLNIVTLQQFFIAFEMFTVQFAFFPFLLMSVHLLSKKTNSRAILIFIAVQFLIASSAHQPVVFYLGALFSVCYGFFLNLSNRKNFRAAVKMALLVGLLTFFANSYWMIPNFYYLIHNAHYVAESRANVLFGPESLWSVREAGDIASFLTGAHYIFDWKHFNFGTLQLDYIFDVWKIYIAHGSVLFLIILFNFFSIGGLILTIFDFKRGNGRWGVVFIYATTVLFMWIGMLLPGFVVDILYSNKSILEAFRNPVTKFSIIYSFAISVLVCQFFEFSVSRFETRKSQLLSKILPAVMVGTSFLAVIYISWPSLTGNFINKKLEVVYPAVYQEMFSYLKTRPANFRVLELPFFSQAGWNYYKWPEGGEQNGYQGLGFYFFGFPQALITPDFARWEETNDFFYHELRHALNSDDSLMVKNVLSKYNVDLVVVDESAISQYMRDFDYDKVHEIMARSGARVVWKKDFLTIYENLNPTREDGFIIPPKIDFTSADLKRVVKDVVFPRIREFVNVTKEEASALFPFSDLNALQLKDTNIQDGGVVIERSVPLGNYKISIPGVTGDVYKTLANFSYSSGQVKITFPKTRIVLNSQIVEVPQFEDSEVSVSGDYDFVTVWADGKIFKIYKNQSAYSLVSALIGESIEFSYAGLDSNDVGSFTSWETYDPSWKEDVTLEISNLSNIRVETRFPVITADLAKFPSENCGSSGRGTITTDYIGQSVINTADSYGVNCSHYDFDFLTPDSSYLMQISGENFSGRSAKFFFNYNSQNTLIEDFLMPSGKFSTVLSLLPIVEEAETPYSINWETRSHGKLARNQLSEIKVMPFETDRLSGIQLLKNDVVLQKENPLVVYKTNKYFNFIYTGEVGCESKCFIGIDQSYDDLWIAVDGNLNILSHFKYNNWANLWEIENSEKIIILYIPQIVSLFALAFVLIFCLMLIIKILFNSERNSN